MSERTARVVCTNRDDDFVWLKVVGEDECLHVPQGQFDRLDFWPVRGMEFDLTYSKGETAFLDFDVVTSFGRVKASRGTLCYLSVSGVGAVAPVGRATR